MKHINFWKITHLICKIIIFCWEFKGYIVQMYLILKYGYDFHSLLTPEFATSLYVMNRELTFLYINCLWILQDCCSKVSLFWWLALIISNFFFKELLFLVYLMFQFVFSTLHYELVLELITILVCISHSDCKNLELNLNMYKQLTILTYYQQYFFLL